MQDGINRDPLSTPEISIRKKIHQQRQGVVAEEMNTLN
jgi:hypothetical protein